MKSFELNAGEHRLELHFRDRDEPWLDRILLTDDPYYHPGNKDQKKEYQYVFIEGESAEFGDGMFTVFTDTALSGGAAIKPSHGAMDFPFMIRKEDNYRVFCRVKIVDYGSDSWFMRVGGREFIWNTLPRTDPPSWIWAEVGDKDNKPIAPVRYEPGKYSIGINGRESGAKLDKIIITNDPDFMPSE